MPARVVLPEEHPLQGQENGRGRQFLAEQNRRYHFTFGESERWRYETLDVCCGVRAYWVDGVLALFAWFSLFYAAAQRVNHPSPRVDLWDSILVFERSDGSTPVRRAAEGFLHDMREWCPARMDQLVLTSMYSVPTLPVALKSGAGIDMWGLMFPVIVVTVLMQSYRFLTVMFACDVPKRYDPSAGPDLGRWLEYMLTSPLQVVIVALSFHLREAAVLWCLGAMQAVLVVMGYSIEREIEALDGGRGRPVGLAVLYGVSCGLHGVIWSVLGERWRRERDVYKTCTGGWEMESMEDIINGIFYSQVVLFSAFGVVPLWTYKYRGSPSEWTRTAHAYSLLSVLAKTLLLYYFIEYISRAEFIFTELPVWNHTGGNYTGGKHLGHPVCNCTGLAAGNHTGHA